MPEIFFAKHLMCPQEMASEDPASLAAFLNSNGLGPNDSIAPGKAYSFDTFDPNTRSILSQFNSLPAHQRGNVARGAEELGDGVNQLALFLKKNLNREQIESINSLVGAGVGTASTRLNEFQKAVLSYQEAVLESHRVEKSHGPGIGHRRHQAHARVQSAFHKLGQAYRKELSLITPEILRSKNRGNALSNPKRALTLAKRSSNGAPDTRLFVANTAEAKRLASLGRGISGLGKLAVAVDTGLRIQKVSLAQQGGRDWLREGALQMTGFGFSGAAGGLAGKYTMVAGTAVAVKAGLLVSGPAGWAVLAVIVGAGLVAGLGAGHIADKVGKSVSATIWDRDWDWSWD